MHNAQLFSGHRVPNMPYPSSTAVQVFSLKLYCAAYTFAAKLYLSKYNMPPIVHRPQCSIGGKLPYRPVNQRHSLCNMILMMAFRSSTSTAPSPVRSAASDSSVLCSIMLMTRFRSSTSTTPSPVRSPRVHER